MAERTGIPLRQYYTLFRRYLEPQWPLALGLTVLLLSNIGLRLVNPQIVRQFIDQVTAAAMGTSPSYDGAVSAQDAALLYLGLAVVQQIVSTLAAYVGRDLGWRATNELRADLADHCLRLDMSFHNAHRPGELIERIDGDTNALSNFFSQFVTQIVGSVLLLFGVLVMLLLVDWRAGATMAAFVLLTLPVMARLQGFGAGMWEQEREASADLYGFLEERLTGTEDIRACGAKAYVMRRFYELRRKAYRRLIVAGTVGAGITENTGVVLFGLGLVAALAVGAYLYTRGTITIGAAYLILHYSNMLVAPIEIISRQMRDLQRAGAGIKRVHQLFCIEPKVVDAPSRTAVLPRGALAVEFRDVSFGYEPEGEPRGEQEAPARDMVLRHLSFRLEPGKVLGLLGRTGSGKTTLSRLLFRLYDPDQGAVCLGRDPVIDLRTLPLTEVRRRVGMVTQEIQLFQASVRDNLTLFDDAIPDERILRVLADVGMRPWLDTLAQGLDTEVASGGSGLSAGEAQLLALARVFLQDPGLVVLDEASSRLDPATEQRIEHALDRLISGRTAIVIAHRLGTVQRADEIMILEGGQVSEQGQRERLARDSASRFYRLLQTGLEEMLV